MSLLSQKTLKKTATFSGVGLHSGKKVEMTIKPSSPNSGITFKRTDLPTKICQACHRSFSWRKKWKTVWDQVKYCSKFCAGKRTRL